MARNNYIKNDKEYPLRPKVLTPLYYSEALASSLILYARQDDSFSSWLRSMVEHELNDSGELPRREEIRDANLLIPSDIHSAMHRAEWLIHKINREDLPGSGLAAEYFNSWIKDKPLDNPKQIVIGLVGVAIPGITLGILPKKRKVMSIIINTDTEALISLRLAARVSRVSHGLVAEALKSVKKKATELEPDLSDWLYGDKHMRFYRTTSHIIKSIKSDLDSFSVPYSIMKKNDTPSILAISPAINSALSESDWNLELLNT